MTQDLDKMITSTSDARLRLRLLAISHFLDGKSRANFGKRYIYQH
ncbi:hypothetical protein [Pseudoalteromonas sp. Ld18]